MKRWNILASKPIVEHFWYRLRQDTVQLPDGKILDDYFVSIRRDVVLIFALTPDRLVPLVRQYKHGVQNVLLELPGGYVDEGEAPDDAARRELLEETGYTAANLHLLAHVHGDPTKDTNTLHLYLAENAVKTQEQALDQTEDITVELLPLLHVRQAVLQGEICVAGSIATIYLALDHLQQLSKTCDG
ncbi:NUDIX domain-containing protein [candidate division KSB3 bacterium]|uniref:NUDIX domain-containing protein n=1 Tax=candidate division KSB3 bacterium TaxID=2044937 RepID=A0A9D5Q897_9BACT|nr:NUDIX domain-containing protein [candidate division KSB3 bacterium]MBD3327253.1 NUDIX domain-containing protein [candidate division KSB3 bacterium]